MIGYVALLGAINVGGNRLKMGDLVAALEENGFPNVSTVAASGNVLFDWEPSCDADIASMLVRVVKDRFGIDTFAAVRTKTDLRIALGENPFVDEGADKLVHVHFLTGQPRQEQFDRLLTDHEGRGPERLAPGTRALHIDYVSGVGNSKLTGPFIERRLGCKGTARNIRSLKRIIEKMS